MTTISTYNPQKSQSVIRSKDRALTFLRVARYTNPGKEVSLLFQESGTVRHIITLSNEDARALAEQLIKASLSLA